MTMKAAARPTVEPGSMGTDDKGETQPQEIARGPVAAIIPIKHLGTNGGGFFGANSAILRVPQRLEQFPHCYELCLFPFALVLMFGRMLRQMRHAWVIFGVMMPMFIASLPGRCTGTHCTESGTEHIPPWRDNPRCPVARRSKLGEP